ncbi:Serine/threonine-specific protein phosphatase/bis(5-nucleosyl)-tetraphosphatase [Penicillium cf. griseofulvum]|uniref:Serine/threonine-specific protein phosphatase/bis(5-nucleosyl)-tetraphosphatase n=1 Tax=Penicillium cf. griseofulvum TaxID=2972120 RepID=A0A9W9MFR4_9EURO|nr:Serine/threonine-specific protein phosphatase/bis(5-nucleosyl)-tetraphosphatase [Penicillium cf. griseofulvum]KAJ5451330.1 Serine/threonine-specific protein phosphatase/bis(5-nucleosyl)-tetraphosphatase [Penicillium cf. griseofulvum]
MDAKASSRIHFRSTFIHQSAIVRIALQASLHCAPMAPRLRSALAKSLLRPLDSSAVFYCPSCAIWRRTLSTRAHTSRSIDKPDTSRRVTRAQITISASTPRTFTTSSIITAKSVPPRFKELHAALEGVKDAALEQVNLSRLQFALRGLESETPLIRVAALVLPPQSKHGTDFSSIWTLVLGLNDATSARKFVRLLLADPLTPREGWEDILDSYDADSSRGLLIRYGEISQSIPNDLLPTISVPSPILSKGNLEILVSTLGSEPDHHAATLHADTFLVPTVTIQTSHSGRHNVVRYPVHRTIVCGRGVDGLLSYSTMIGRADLKNEASSVRGAIELAVADQKSTNERLSLVDVDRASTALDKFRESVHNASDYERGWNGSGVQPLIDWLATFSEAPTGNALNPALVPLVESLIDAADASVVARDAKALHDQTTGVTPEETRSNLDWAVTSWAERAHSELRSSLDAGLASPRWRGLAWWKLFWRVDDVSMITSEILQRKFLRQAEQEVIWTVGKYQQAGLLEEHASSNIDSAKDSAMPPWPTQIPDLRTKLLTSTVPSLQALAQTLVLFSVSTTTLTSALSALTYVAIPSAGVYESCTLAAVGLIYSLRRQQKRWDVARDFWEEEVREEGRTSLLETEVALRDIVRNGGKTMEEVSDTHARKSVARARQALEEVKA